MAKFLNYTYILGEGDRFTILELCILSSLKLVKVKALGMLTMLTNLTNFICFAYTYSARKVYTHCFNFFITFLFFCNVAMNRLELKGNVRHQLASLFV